MEQVASPIIIIEAGKSERQYWKDIWRYRELFYFLAWRDVVVRYKQTVIGIGWSIVRPLLTMLIFTVIFSKIAHLPSRGVPYPVLVFAGMLPWQFFANGLADSSDSLIANSNMVSKLYFPRIIVPISAIISALADFVITLGLLAIIMLVYKFRPHLSLLFISVFTILAVLATAGSGLILSALNVKFRDFRYIVPFIVQFGLYVSPVGFSSTIVPSRWRFFYSLNPMVSVIDGFRWCIIGNSAKIDLLSFGISATMIFVLLGIGISYFRRMERSFADII